MALTKDVSYGFLEANPSNSKYKLFLGVPLSDLKEVSFDSPSLHVDNSGKAWYGIKVEISRNPPLNPAAIKYKSYILDVISAGKPMSGVLVQCENLNTNQIRFLLMAFDGYQQENQFTPGDIAFNCPYIYVDSNNSKPEMDQPRVFVPSQGYQLIGGTDQTLGGNAQMELVTSPVANAVIDSNTINNHPGHPMPSGQAADYAVSVFHFDQQHQQQQGSPKRSKAGGKVVRIRAGGIGRPLPAWTGRAILIRSTTIRRFIKAKQ